MQGPTRNSLGCFVMLGSVRGSTEASESVKNQPGVYRIPIMAREDLVVVWVQHEVAGDGS